MKKNTHIKLPTFDDSHPMFNVDSHIFGEITRIADGQKIPDFSDINDYTREKMLEDFKESMELCRMKHPFVMWKAQIIEMNAYLNQFGFGKQKLNWDAHQDKDNQIKDIKDFLESEGIKELREETEGLARRQRFYNLLPSIFKCKNKEDLRNAEPLSMETEAMAAYCLLQMGFSGSTVLQIIDSVRKMKEELSDGE